MTSTVLTAAMMLANLFPQTQLPAATSQAVAIVSARDGQSASCELHVFPTREIIDSSPDYAADAGFSVIGALVGGAYSAIQSGGSGKLKAGALDQMKILFNPDTQVAELQRVDMLSILRLPVDTKIVQEATLPAPFGDKPSDPAQADAYKRFWQAMKRGTPIVTPANACYRELYVAAISISKGLGSLKFSTSFIYRVFDAGQHEIHAFDGENSVPLQNYVSLKAAPSAADLNGAFAKAFSANFTQWAARRVKS